VEVEGIYRHTYEMEALLPNKNTKGSNNAVWIDFAGNLTNIKTKKQLIGNDFSELEKLYDKRIKVVGVFNKENKGHLDTYFGRIQNIISVEVIE
jgi:hypothetical protein